MGRNRGVVFCLMLLIIGLSASVLRAERSTSEEFEFPFLAKVKATKLNLRSGPGEKFAVMDRIEYGTVLTVLEEKLDSKKMKWFKVPASENVTFFVATKYLFNSDGKTAEVTASVLNVRSQKNLKRAALGQLKRGDVVTVLGNDKGWTRIAAPEGFGLWLSSKYVDYVAPVQMAGSEEPVEEAIALEENWRAIFEETNNGYLAECQKDVQDWDFAGLEVSYIEVMTGTTDENLIDLVNSRLAMIDLRSRMRDQVLGSVHADAEQEVKLADIEAKYEGLLAERARLKAEAEKAVTYDAVGWLHPAGRFIGRPSAWRLENDGKILIYLDLDEETDYVNGFDEFGFSYVGVNGTFLQVEADEDEDIEAHQVLIVSEITVLKR